MARSWTSRSSSHFCSHIHRRISGCSRSKLVRTSEPDGGQFVIARPLTAVIGNVVGGFSIGRDFYGADQIRPLRALVLLQHREELNEGLDGVAWLLIVAKN